MTPRKVTFTRFNTATDQSAKPETLPWESWVALLTAPHAVRGSPTDSENKHALDVAKNGPSIVLGKLPLGAPHDNASVEEIHALGLDIEDAPEEKIAAAIAALAGFEMVIYTTHKHGAPAANKDPALRTRLRIILPLAEPVSPAKQKTLWAALNAKTGSIADRKTKNVGRLYFLPSTYDPEIAWSHHESCRWISEGDLIEQENTKAV